MFRKKIIVGFWLEFTVGRMLTVLIHRVTVLDHNDELAFTLGILICAVTCVNHDVTMSKQLMNWADWSNLWFMLLFRMKTVNKTTMILEKRESSPLYIFNCDYCNINWLRPFDLSFVWCYTAVFQDTFSVLLVFLSFFKRFFGQNKVHCCICKQHPLLLKKKQKKSGWVSSLLNLL